MKLSFTELERVLEALEKGDGEVAAQRMVEHIGNAADFAAEFRKQKSARKRAA